MLSSNRNAEKEVACLPLCPACGEQFDCLANASELCWCSEIQLNEKAIIELQDRYQGCLCRKCLVKFAEDESPKSCATPLS